MSVDKSASGDVVLQVELGRLERIVRHEIRGVDSMSRSADWGPSAIVGIQVTQE